MAVLICPECGAENLPGDEYCWACRTALTAAETVDESEQAKQTGDDLEELLNSEEDLPGLLHALKQDVEIGGEQEDGQDDQPDELSDNLDQEDSDQSDALDDDPVWLRRIRQRAKQEKDSIGEVTQKISAAQESLSDEKRSSQHESYAEWIEQLRQESPQKPGLMDSEGDTLPDQAIQSSQTEEPGWLAKIRKVHGKPLDNQSSDIQSAERLSGDSLLQWLVDLENGKEELVPRSEEDEIISEKSGDALGEGDQTELAADGDSTQEIRIKQQKASMSVLSISREEQLEADQLSATIVDETAPRAVRKAEKPNATWIIRVAVTIILITVLSFSLFSGTASSSQPASLKPQHRSLLSWVEKLPVDSKLLLVFDYHAGFERELSVIAQPILSKIVQASAEIFLLSSTESGVLLAEDLLGDIDGIENVTIHQVGYFPAANYAAFGLGAGYDASWRLLHAPDSINELPQGNLEGVLVLSDSFEGGRIWIEQIYARFPDAPLNLITTAQVGPMLLPYYESHQLTGLVSGLSEARQMIAYLNVGNSINHIWQAYRTGMLMMIIVIALGLFFMADQDHKDLLDVQGGEP